MQQIEKVQREYLDSKAFNNVALVLKWACLREDGLYFPVNTLKSFCSTRIHEAYLKHLQQAVQVQQQRLLSG